jgi:toxin FitB
VFLLDTNVISEFAKPAPDTQVTAWLRRLPAEELFLSAVSVGEIQKGIALARNPERQIRLQRWLEAMLQRWFEGRLLIVDRDIASRWGQIAAARQRSGRPLPVTDGLIAATALQHNLTVATRNTPDFDIPGLKLINPWNT